VQTEAAPAAPRGAAGTIAVTVRLDPERYERLKIHGAKTRRTNQDILVEALDAYFAAKA
jgi:predicted DNA-binding protein